MTTSTPTPEASRQHEQPATWGDIAVSFAGTLTSAQFRRGDLAELRRMEPDSPSAAVFWMLLAEHEDVFQILDAERKWALILHGIARMTPTNSGTERAARAHDRSTSVGRALFVGDGDTGENGFYSEMRLKRLLAARGPMLRTLLARMFRMMGSAGVYFNWWEMANFIRYADDSEELAEEARRRIARNYYQAKRRSSRTAEEQSD